MKVKKEVTNMKLITSSKDLLEKDERILCKTTRHPISILGWVPVLLITLIMMTSASKISVSIGNSLFTEYSEEECALWNVTKEDPFYEDIWKTLPEHRLIKRVVVFLCLIIVCVGVYDVTDFITREFVVTNKKVFTKAGLIGLRVSNVYLHKTESTSSTQGPIKRIFECGDISITGTGGKVTEFCSLIDYKEFIEAIESAVSQSRTV